MDGDVPQQQLLGNTRDDLVPQVDAEVGDNEVRVFDRLCRHFEFRYGLLRSDLANADVGPPLVFVECVWVMQVKFREGMADRLYELARGVVCLEQDGYAALFA